jgi:hypothetical protein
MSATDSVPVRVIFDSTQRRRRGPVAYVSRRSAGKSILILGLLNFAVAGTLYYVIWWRVDPFLAVNMVLKTPIIADIPQADLEAAVSQMFGMPLQTRREAAADVTADSDAARSRWSGGTTQRIIPGAAYTWLTLATMGYCFLALAGGAAFGAGLAPGELKRLAGLLLTLFLVGGLAYGGYIIFTKYRTGYPVEYLRYGMGGLALLAAALGLALSPQGRGLRRAIRLASYCIILSAIASVLGVYLWREAGAIEPQYATPAMLALIFAAHSAWGWLLFIFSFRL